MSFSGQRMIKKTVVLIIHPKMSIPELGVDLDVLVEVFALLRGEVVGLQPLPVVLVHL